MKTCSCTPKVIGVAKLEGELRAGIKSLSLWTLGSFYVKSTRACNPTPSDLSRTYVPNFSSQLLAVPEILILGPSPFFAEIVQRHLKSCFMTAANFTIISDQIELLP